MKMSMSDKIAALRRTFPKIDRRTRFLYDGKLNRRATSNSVALHILAWSDDGRVTLHRTVFRKPGLTVSEWHSWLRAHAGPVIQNQVRASMGRTHGGQWTVERIFGWHFFNE